MADVFYLARFRNAHENGLKGSGRGTYEQALQEIKDGRKMGHWMWYIFAKVLDVFYAGSRHNMTMHYIRTKNVFS